MYRTDPTSSGRPPGVRIPRDDADRAEDTRATGDRWLAELLRSDQVSTCVIEMPLPPADPPDFRFLATSPAFEQSTGLHDAVGRTMRELRPDHEQYWFDLFRQVAETGEPVCFEHAARALERRFRGHAFRLGGLPKPRVVVISAATQDTGIEGLERFGATLAHELRSPLASMSNGLQLLKRQLCQDAGSQKTMSMMERQIARLGGLIDDMLEIGRLGSTDVRLHCETVDLHHVISEAIEACGAAIELRRHEVGIDSDGAALQVRGDLRRLVQVFTNLLANSIKYTAPGGHIRFRLHREDGMAVVAVRDDGVGIPPEQVPHVFDLYNQGLAHGLQADGGLGIGLAIVRSVVRLHGGTVSAHSEGKCKGSTFTVRLPLQAR